MKSVRYTELGINIRFNFNFKKHEVYFLLTLRVGVGGITNFSNKPFKWQIFNYSADTWSPTLIFLQQSNKLNEVNKTKMLIISVLYFPCFLLIKTRHTKYHKI